MTIEFPDEPVEPGAPGADTASPGRTVEVRRAVPWAVPAALALVALFLPVTTIVVPGDVDAVGTVRAAIRVSLHPFGSYSAAGMRAGVTGGPAFGWVWLVLLVGFAAAGGWSVLRPAARWPGVLGVAVGAAGVGGVGSLVLSLDAAVTARTVETGLAAGAWVALAAAVVGLVVGVLVLRQSVRSPSARANAGG